MESIIYKVIFKAIQQSENKNLTLNFRNVNLENPLIIPSKLLPKLIDLSDKSNEIIFFQNIEEVIVIGNMRPKFVYNYYRVLLFILKSNKEKRGYLISNVKDIGDIIIGVWPFNQKESEITPEIILKKLNDFLNNPKNYSNICVISQ